MTEEQRFIDALKAIEEATPFKTVIVPDHIMDELALRPDRMHLTVDKSFEVTDDNIRAAIKDDRTWHRPFTFGDLDWVESIPPHSGITPKPL